MIIKPIETCIGCGSTSWNLDRTHIDLHGWGIRCAKCDKFLRWTGKEKPKAKNPKHRAKHRADGEMFCDWCGITESEAKRMGHHFTIDHAEAEQFGGDDGFENTRPLCSSCHYLKTALEFKTKGIRRLLDED
jgi:hypothetical protein